MSKVRSSGSCYPAGYSPSFNPIRSLTACCVGQKRHGTLSKITAFHARQRRWRNWPAFLPKGLRLGSRDDSRSTPLQASISGLRAKLDHWFDRPLKFVASFKPNKKAQPHDPVLRGSVVRAGLKERVFDEVKQ